jgi:spermidine/putrescine transport system ATP-binding protein
VPSPAVEIRHLVKEFEEGRGGTTVRAVDDVTLTVQEGEFFALLGPSGCGKTTTLRVIAGFEEPSSGEVLLRGRPVQQVPPFHRPVNTVFQDYALFPHMTVLQNVMFGLRMARVPVTEARRRAREALELVRLPRVEERRPTQLSGGQKQRVALARALVNEPAVLLLDEPLGALDLKLRKAMQDELKNLQQRVGITFIYVTHDQEEALTMADRIAVMNAGRALQVGCPDEIYERPVDRFVADFIGETNFLAGRLEHRGDRGIVTLRDGRRVEGVMRDPDLTVGAEAVLAVRPEKVELRAADDAALGPDSGWTTLPGVVAGSRYIGTDTRYHVDVGGELEVVARVQNRAGGVTPRFPEASRVLVRWRSEDASVLR